MLADTLAAVDREVTKHQSTFVLEDMVEDILATAVADRVAEQGGFFLLDVAIAL
jgi:hypothetical protein